LTLTIFLDVAERFERLEAQVAELAEDSKTVKDLETRMMGMETDIGKMTSALERFLGQIRIDDGLRLVPDNRALGPVPPLAIRSAPGTVEQMDVGESGPGSGPDAPEPMDSDFEHGEDLHMMATPVTATTPSDFPDDDRMVSTLSPHVSGQVPPTRLAADWPMAPPPPPVNIIPSTPQQSQESGQQEGLRVGRDLLEPGEIEQGPVIRARARSRTPLGVNVASSSRLEPPATRSRSRSKPPK
jgi:hypothetical protein